MACYSTTPPHTSTPQLLVCHPRTFGHLHAPRNEPIWLDKTFERDFLTVSELYSPARQSSQTHLSTKGSNLGARNISAHGTHHFRPHLGDAKQPPRVRNSLWCLANTTNMWGGVDSRCLVPCGVFGLRAKRYWVGACQQWHGGACTLRAFTCTPTPPPDSRLDAREGQPVGRRPETK